MKSRVLMPIVICALGCFPLLPAKALAGVVLTDADGGQVFLSDGRFKQVDDEEQTFVFDADSETMTIIDHERRIYARGTPDEFCESGSSMMEQAMAEMSPEERAMMEQMMGGLKQEHAGKKPDVEVRRTGRGDTIAGYDTVKYRVTVDGAPYEELWLTGDAAIMEEFGRLHRMVELTARMGECFGGGMGLVEEDFVESHPDYIALFQGGYPLKSVSLDEGETEVEEEIVRVEQRSIADSEFNPPQDYRQVSFQVLMAGE